MTEIYLIRHAEAEGNAYRRFHGQYNSLITPNGHRQIKALSKRFADIPVDACYASDLTRTCITAGAIYSQKQIPLRKDSAFREVSVGVLEDMPFGWLHRFAPEVIGTFNRNPLHWTCESAETFMEYTGRFLARMEQLAKQHDGQTIAIVSHGCAIRGVLLRLFYDPENPAFSYCDNTAVSHIFYENGTYRCDYINDNSHLTPDISTLIRQRKQSPETDPKDTNLWYRPVAGDRELEQMLASCGVKADENFTLDNLTERGEALLAMRRDEPIGLIATERALHHPKEATLRMVCLKPEYRGQRFGTQILGAAVSFSRRNGRKLLTLQVDAAEEKAIGFFIHNGMQVLNSIEADPLRLTLVRNLDPADAY